MQRGTELCRHCTLSHGQYLEFQNFGQDRLRYGAVQGCPMKNLEVFFLKKIVKIFWVVKKNV